MVGASGALITASRLDHGGPGGMARARSKAWIAATQQIPSTEHLHRMTTLPAPISAGFVGSRPEAAFPGAGGMPVRDAAARVVAGIAASGATVSPFLPAGVAPEVVIADGEPANPEDLLIAYALGHPVRRPARRRRGPLDSSAFGDLRRRRAGREPRAWRPLRRPRAADLDWARGLARPRPAPGRERDGLRVGVAVVDRGGDPIQQDRMDDAPAAGVDVALATAAAAARFGAPERSTWPSAIDGAEHAPARSAARLPVDCPSATVAGSSPGWRRRAGADPLRRARGRRAGGAR